MFRIIISNIALWELTALSADDSSVLAAARRIFAVAISKDVMAADD